MPGSVPIVDVSDLASNDVAKRRHVGKTIRAIYEELGFLYIAGHGVPDDLTARVFAASRRFHALPLARKMELKINEAHRGYMPIATSTIVTSSVAKVTRPNLSESLMVMHEVAPDDPEWGQPLQGPNRWPGDLPGFRDDILAYDAAQRALAERLTLAVALAFDLDEDWFAPHFARPTTWLRLLHYPPHPAQAPDDQFGSAPHTDYGFLTILAQDESGGLQVRGNDGAWIDAIPVPGTFVVNVADILMRWTDGVLRSTPHRVRNVSGRDRYSLPYFFDPNMDTLVSRLPGVNDGTPPRWAPVRFGDYLMERLDKNYAYRQRAAG
jgi:isopenicillin N synthase-like dioxygenase